MKKTLLFFLLAIGGAANAQTTLFEDSFETYTDFAITGVGSWTLTDVDLKLTYGFTGITFPNSGVAKSFQVFNASMTVPALDPTATSDWTARTGDKSMVCFAASQPTAAPLNNDWLISPQITLASTGNVLSFWAKSCDADYGLERFKVAVSTTGTAVANFTVISTGSYIITPDDITWYEYTYDLDAYANMPVYIGINCVSNDQFGFAVDDFKVTTTQLGTEEFFNQNFALYPNPVSNMLNISTKNGTILNNITITDVNGRIVRNTDTNEITQTQVDISNLQSGIYFVKITSNAASAIKKIIKQ